MAVIRNRSFFWVATLLVGVISTTHKLEAQTIESKQLLLKDAISAAMVNNTTLKVADIETQISKSNFRQTNAVFLPRVEVGYSAMSTTNALNVFGFKLQQENIKAADFDPAVLNNPSHTEDFSARIEVLQPLVNLDLFYQRAAARIQNELYEHKYKRAQEYIRFDVQKTYLNLQLAYQSVKVLEESLSIARRIEKNTQNFYDQGLLRKSDLLNVQVNVATLESHLTKAQSMTNSESESLALAMGETPGTVYLTDSLILIKNTDAFGLQQVAPNRADLLAMKKAVEATRMMEQSEKMNLVPRVNAFGSYQYNDAKTYRFEASSYLVGMKLSWTLFDGTKTYHAINARKAEREKMEVQLKQQQDQSQLELNKIHRDRLDFLSEINRQNVSVAQAQESLRILQDRYNEGLASTTDLLMAHSQLLQQKLAFAQAIYGNNLTLAYLEFLGANE